MINNSKFKNRLGEETSPYLLQHAHNPVDWYPWGEEALNKAKIENKPILVSIGYSACHWCHVMEHESFEDEGIAKIMNSFFINIKVDREERPDVDSVYMDALHAMGLRGGWPLNVFLMPNAKPFYGGTYFPKKNWANLLYSIHNAFETESEKLYKSAEGFADSLNQKDTEKYNLKFEDSTEVKGFTKEELDQMVSRISQDFDLVHGGLQRSPKFPMPSIWLFLVRYLSINDNESLIKHLKFTLDRIALGGIYDHLGGAWTRYSTDEYWKIPHFEKMLYDNGQLLSLYSEALALFKNKNIFEDSQKLYLESVNKTIDWLKNEMYSPDHGFYSAQDADSEGVEGKYYVWSEQEIDQILGNNNEFKTLFEIKEHGNWEDGHNVLHLEIIPNDSEWEKLSENFKSLKIQRDQRIKPGLDNKIICSWNGLAMNGLVSAYKVTNNIEYLNLALKNARFIKDSLTVDVFNEDQNKGRGLQHIYNSKKQIFGFLDDYASVIQAYSHLYQVCFEETWLHEAYELSKYCIANFYDEKEGLFFFTDIQGEELIARKKEIFDNVIPSSNSMMASNLFVLGHFFEDNRFIEISHLMFGLVKKLCLQDIQWVSNWANFGLGLSGPLTEIAIFSNSPTTAKAYLDSKTYLPFAMYASSDKPSPLPLLLNRVMMENSDTFYVCLDKTCHLPTTSFEKTLKILQSSNA